MFKNLSQPLSHFHHRFTATTTALKSRFHTRSETFATLTFEPRAHARVKHRVPDG